MLKSVIIRSTLAAVACAISLSAHAMADAPKQLNIPAGKLVLALEALEKQATIELIFQTEQIKSFNTRGLTGTYEPKDAVRILLKGTSLELRTDPTGALVIAAPPNSKILSTLGEREGSRDSGEDPFNTRGSFQLAQASSGQAKGDAPVENDQTPAKRPRAEALQEIVVTGHYQFLSVDTSGATNLPLPIEQVPQSISLVSNDFIQAADLKTLSAIAEYTPGAVNAGNSENVGTLIRLRGFNAGQSIDGLNILNGTQFEPDYAIYDRLEIVKGPSSLVYGIASPGGLVNFVTKSATDLTPTYLLAEDGFWSSYRLEGQIAGALDTQGHVRAIGIAVQDQGNSFLNEMNHKRTSVYGGLNVDLGNSVTAYLHGGYERQVVTSYDGVLTEADGSPAPVPRSFFIGSGNIETTTDVYHAEGDLTWHATDMMDLSIKGNYQRSSLGGAQAYGLGLLPSGVFGINVVSHEDVPDSNYGIGVSSIYKFDNLGLKNSFLSLAALYQDSYIRTHYLYDTNFSATAAIFDGQAAVSQAFDSLLASPSLPYDSALTTKVLTISGQTILQPFDPLTLLLGVSYSKPKESVAVGGPYQDFNFPGHRSYRAGVTYELLPKTYAYVSYSESFEPQPGYTVNGTPILPLTGVQYEAGLKFRSGNGRLLLTGALFRIKEANFQIFDQQINGNDYFKTIGSVTHKGLELQALGQITPDWQVNMGYAYLDPKITGNQDPATVGQTELYRPKQTFSLYTTYTLPNSILRGLSIGGGIRYVSSQQTSYRSAAANVGESLSPTIDLPGYTLVDAALGYTIDKWRVQLNAHNMFDKHYFINNYQTLIYGNVSGDPANVTLSVRRQF